jgi:pyruvate/2-oxoglutarate/acetoin dehydrogenase E1 component
MVEVALRAAEKLKKENISLEVVDLLSVKPIDIGPVIESVKKTNRCVVAHEACKTCGVGAEIAALVAEHAFDYLDAPVLRVATKDVPIPFNNSEEEAALVKEADLIEAVRKLI